MKPLFGFEIELIADTSFREFDVQFYHEGKYTDDFLKGFWKVESDSSLSIYEEERDKFLAPETGEFISIPLTPADIPKAFKEFKEFFGSPDLELDEVLSFNKSTGCHLHFSEDTGTVNELLTYTHLAKMRKNVLKRVKDELPTVFPHFKKQYFRGYAQEIKKPLLDKHSREVEFNCGSLDHGLEWRSFNLCGVTTWEQLDKLISIAVEEVTTLLKDLEKDHVEEIELNTNSTLIEVTSEVSESSVFTFS